MPQSINYSNNPQNDYDELYNYIRTSMNFGFLHESIIVSIEDSINEIFNSYSFEMAFEETEDKEYFVRVFRNAIFCHTNYREMDDEEINQMIIDYSKE